MNSEEWDARYSGTELVWSATPNQFVAAETADLPPGRALDLATGEGRNAVWLAEQGWTVTGVDFSAAGLAKAGRLAAERGVQVDWVHADVLEHTPDPASYDLVMVIYLQIAPAALDAVFERAVPALAPGGTFLVVGHDLANLTEGTGGPQDPDRLYTAEAITARLDGLKIVKAGQVLRTVQGADRQAVDTLVRAVRPA